jgi:hypothetical protein
MRELNGWYENEYGAVPFTMPAETLLDAVIKMRFEDTDFGYTDMEVNWGTLDDYEDVGLIIYKLVEGE